MLASSRVNKFEQGGGCMRFPESKIVGHAKDEGQLEEGGAFATPHNVAFLRHNKDPFAVVGGELDDRSHEFLQEKSLVAWHRDTHFNIGGREQVLDNINPSGLAGAHESIDHVSEMCKRAQPKGSEALLNNIVDQHGRFPSPAWEVSMAERRPIGARFAELQPKRAAVPIFPKLAIDMEYSLPKQATFPIILSNCESSTFVGD